MDAGRANRKKFKKRQQRDIKEQAEKAAGQEVEEKAPNWRERMDRLLTQEEALEASLQDKENGLDIITIYLKAQDAKTAHLVATQIFKQLEERCPHTPDDAFDWIKRMCPDCFHDIQSKYMEGKDERTD